MLAGRLLDRSARPPSSLSQTKPPKSHIFFIFQSFKYCTCIPNNFIQNCRPRDSKLASYAIVLVLLAASDSFQEQPTDNRRHGRSLSCPPVRTWMQSNKESRQPDVTDMQDRRNTQLDGAYLARQRAKCECVSTAKSRLRR